MRSEHSRRRIGQTKGLSFWTSIPLDELITLQGVQPAEDLDQLSALWPEDDDPDHMLAHILERRSAHRGTVQKQDKHNR